MSDLIRREGALREARPEYLNPQQEKLASYNQGWNNALDEYFDRIKELPSEDRPKGKWIDDGDTLICNKCNTAYSYPIFHNGWNYCPNCGVDMRGDNNV